MKAGRGASPLLTVGRAPGGWTVAYLEGLPATGYRYELHDGALLLAPPAPPWHGRLADRLVKAFEVGLWPALAAVGIAFGPRDVRVAAVAAFLTVPHPATAYHSPVSVAVAVEFAAADPDLRHLPYARANIPEYWRVDPDPVDRSDAVVTMHRLALRESGPVYLVERVRRLSALERDGIGA